MEAKCFRKGCDFTVEVPHMDGAVSELREHYRASHPTKRFLEAENQQWLEQWNTTVDEWLTEVCVGPDGNTDYGYLNEYLRGYMGTVETIPQGVRDDLQQVYDNWFQERQQAAHAAAPGNPWRAGVVEAIAGVDAVAAPAPRFVGRRRV